MPKVIVLMLQTMILHTFLASSDYKRLRNNFLLRDRFDVQEYPLNIRIHCRQSSYIYKVHIYSYTNSSQATFLLNCSADVLSNILSAFPTSKPSRLCNSEILSTGKLSYSGSTSRSANSMYEAGTDSEMPSAK